MLAWIAGMMSPGGAPRRRGDRARRSCAMPAASAFRSTMRSKGRAGKPKFLEITGRSLVNRAIRPERIERKRKRDVVGNVSQSFVLLPLHDHISDIAASYDGCLV